jgi:hypothetical protein
MHLEMRDECVRLLKGEASSCVTRLVNAQTVQVKSLQNHMSGNPTNQELA